LEQHPADLNTPVGDDASILEDRMVEIRVVVPDETGARGLRHHLVSLFGRPCVSFDRAGQEMRVRSELESRAVVQVIAAVQSWLAADGTGSVRLSVGDRSYLMVDPNAPDTSSLRR
jgi:predicted DCC family thiol-disulfide oxidoreductase YuxK